ncbi:MAG: c-type cytochrome [Deltaproteobacteria bacterium]
MKSLFYFLICISFSLLIACGSKENNAATAGDNSSDKEAISADPKLDKGVGPITSLTLNEKIDDVMAKKGLEIFNAKCTACHKPDKKYIGPAPKGILDRRSPEFVMNMILKPEKMIAENDLVKQMVGEYNGAVMANQNLTEEEARAVLEYFRTL